MTLLFSSPVAENGKVRGPPTNPTLYVRRHVWAPVPRARSKSPSSKPISLCLYTRRLLACGLPAGIEAGYAGLLGNGLGRLARRLPAGLMWRPLSMLADPVGFFRSVEGNRTLAALPVARVPTEVAFLGLYIVNPELRGRNHARSYTEPGPRRIRATASSTEGATPMDTATPHRELSGNIASRSGDLG